MRKSVKGAIAAGAAIVLVAGTGITLAFWNDSAEVAGGTFTAGDLSLEVVADSTSWQLLHDGGTLPVPEPVVIDDVSTVRLVPGDQLDYFTTLNVFAQGQNLKANLTIAPSAVQPVDPDNPADVALAALIIARSTIGVNGVPVGGGPIQIQGSNAGETVPIQVVVTIAWPFGGEDSPAADNPAATGAVNLENYAVVLTQIDGNTPVVPLPAP